MKDILSKTLQVVLDLNKYESNVLSVLMAHGKSNTRKLTIISGVPRSRIYDVAGTLELKGLVKKNDKFISKKKKTIATSWESVGLNDMEKSIESALTKNLKAKMRLIKGMRKQIEREVEEEREECMKEAKI